MLVVDDRPPARLRWVLSACLVAALALALWAWTLNAESRAIRALPSGQRVALYRMTHDSLIALCIGNTEPTLDSHCREQARLILGFPECDARCQRLAAGIMSPRR